MFRPILILLSILFLANCANVSPGAGHRNIEGPSTVRLQNQLTLPYQTLPSQTIRSVQLYRGSPGQAPIIQLNSGQRLTLSFDDLVTSSEVYRVEITHHNSDWRESGLLPNFYLQGFHDDTFTGGTPGRFQNPSYQSFSYTFPNDQIRVTRSGNFMIHVYRQHNNEKLFSMPFFVHENQGQTFTEIEELLNQDVRYLRNHQLFANYHYEDTSIIPQNDLTVYFVQNQFWSNARRANREDFSEQFNARLYLSRDRAFIGTYEFFDLSLSNIDRYSPQIVDFDQRFQIPTVTLNRDVVNLTPIQHRRTRVSNNPRNDREARYALVRFQLEIPPNEVPHGEIYVVGGFNLWGIHEANRLVYNASTGYFTGTAIIKEGSYSYKYVVKSGNTIDDTILDASFASTVQEYHTLVYLRDLNFHYDRLVSVNSMMSEP